MVSNSRDIYYYYDENGAPIGLNWNNTDYYYYKNMFGDVLGIMDSNGTMVVRYSYDAWGNPISTTGSMASTLGQDNPFRYRGYYYDTETGFYYLNARYYNPEWCRFISADPVLDTSSAVGCNMFAYCSNDPINKVDPSGLRNVSSTSLETESQYDRFISSNWQKIVLLEKYNPTPIGTIDTGKVYIVENLNSIKAVFPGDVVILDYRNSNKSPGVQIRNSALISQDSIMLQILHILDQYEQKHPSRWIRNQNINDMLTEWKAHNDIYCAMRNSRCLHVDIDNGDFGVSYSDYWWRAFYAICE